MKNFILAACLVTASLSTQATLIEYKDYSRDSQSQIVRGKSLEWLKWDQTNGLSVNQALARYAEQGWRLASHQQMADLMSDFVFGKTDWLAFPVNDRQSASTPFTVGFNGPSDYFVQLFGNTNLNYNFCLSENRNCYVDGNYAFFTLAFYGDITDSKALFSRVSVATDYQVDYGRHKFFYAQTSLLQLPLMTADTMTSGVALVRTTQPSIAVSSPSTAVLLLLAVMGLFGRSRHSSKV